MATLYVRYYREIEIDYLEVSLETFIVLFAKQLCKECDVQLVFVRTSNPKILNAVPMRKFAAVFNEESEIEPEVLNCGLPILKISQYNLYIAGICPIVRHLFKNNGDEGKRLLGFRHRSLMSCAEVSYWTKFCEFDLINATKSYISSCHVDSGLINFPKEIWKFEEQLGQPVCIRNADRKVKNSTKRSIEVKSTPCHDFVEGTEMTIADVIIFACINLILTQSSMQNVSVNIPRVLTWYNRMVNNSGVKYAVETLGCKLLDKDITMTFFTKCNIAGITQTDSCIRNEDSVKIKGKNHTHQGSVDTVLEKLANNDIEPLYREQDYGDWARNFWDDLPAAAHPREGELPEERLEHKCQQLLNLTCAACSLSKSGDIIVDFCSGGGHLGILLAVKLPKCRIILVENKEISVEKALRRIQKLKLNNCIVYQCNLSRFQGRFNVGVALHACGVATDLVLNSCIAQRASFVVCPCCYGATRDTPTITHPMSKSFNMLSISEYLTLCHAADQTHRNGHKQIQGKFCMGLVDTDRLLRAKSAGYTVSLSTLQPPECTLKNNLLIGTPAT